MTNNRAATPSDSLQSALSFPPVKSSQSLKRRKAVIKTEDSVSDTVDDDEQDIKPTTKKARNANATSTGLTAEVKADLVDHIIRLAYTAMNKDVLAAQLGITKKQLVNAICAGRVNLRSKLIEAARTL